MSRTAADARAVTRLANDSLEIAVTELGGQIVSLRSRATQREWLWKNPHLPPRTIPPLTDDFGPYDTGGWDEVFPTVTPCTVAESPWGCKPIADHGELWHRPWKIADVNAADDGGSLTQVVDEPGLPFRFERKLALAPGHGALSIAYKVENRNEAPLPFLWAAHPLFAVERGMKITLPAGLRVTSTLCQGFHLTPDAGRFIWPHLTLADGTAFDFSRVPSREAGIAVKLFLKRLIESWVSITAADGRESLQISFGVETAKYLALWLNYGAWSGAGTPPYFNCGIEPTTSPFDSLADAHEARHSLVLLPQSGRKWHISLRVAAT